MPSTELTMSPSASIYASLFLMLFMFQTNCATTDDTAVVTTNSPAVVTMPTPCLPHQFCQCPSKTPLCTFLPKTNSSNLNASAGEDAPLRVPETEIPDEKSRGWLIYGPVGGLILIIVLLSAFVWYERKRSWDMISTGSPLSHLPNPTTRTSSSSSPGITTLASGSNLATTNGRDYERPQFGTAVADNCYGENAPCWLSGQLYATCLEKQADDRFLECLCESRIQGLREA